MHGFVCKLAEEKFSVETVYWVGTDITSRFQGLRRHITLTGLYTHA